MSVRIRRHGNHATRIKSALASAILLLCTASGAWAQWTLDGADSSLKFISVKNGSIAESHGFTSLSGTVEKNGAVQIDIALDSVDTLIEIRDERMREMLFQTADFPTATITANIDPETIAAASAGETVITNTDLTLSLHGSEKTLSASLLVIGSKDGPLQAVTRSPVVVNAADFGLVPGLDALQKVAGLNAISGAVPVTVHLVFLPE